MYLPFFIIYRPFSYSSMLSEIAYSLSYDYEPFFTSYMAIVPSVLLDMMFMYYESYLRPLIVSD